jgi:hypothetical protein
MAAFIPIDSDLIKIGDLTSNEMRDVSQQIVNFDVSLTMDGASELTIEVVDVDFAFAKANYFQVRRDVSYQDMRFEIAVVEVSRSESIHPLYRISCRNKNVQMMKRDKSPEAYRATSASEYARLVAKRFNMDAFVENTTKKQSIVKGRSSQADESVWDVLQRAANDAQFVCFETNNILFFCSQQFLLSKWGDPRYKFGEATFIPFGWPDVNEEAFPGANKRYVLLEMPTFRRSDDDPMDAEGQLIVDRTNGRLIRPGMTVWVGGVPDFESVYLVTGVEFSEGEPDPVTINFRTPLKPDEEQKNSTGTSGGGRRTPKLAANIANAIRDYIKRNLRFDARGVRNSADVYEARLRTTGDTVIAAAEAIVAATSQQAKQALYDKYRDLWGAEDIKYKCLLSVRRYLLGSRFATASTSGLPNRVLSRITTYITQRVPPGSERNTLLARARNDASQIYKATTRSRQNRLFDTYLTRYGRDAISYRVLEHVKPLLTKPDYPALDANFPIII